MFRKVHVVRHLVSGTNVRAFTSIDEANSYASPGGFAIDTVVLVETPEDVAANQVTTTRLTITATVDVPYAQCKLHDVVKVRDKLIAEVSAALGSHGSVKDVIGGPTSFLDSRGNSIPVTESVIALT